MATLYVRARTVGDGTRRYDVKYRRGGRHFPLEHAGSFRTRREANLRRDLVADMLAAGLNPRVELARLVTPDRTLALAADEWLASRVGVAPGTLAGYGHRMPVLLDTFGRRSIVEITPADVIGWIAMLQRTYKPGTVRLFVSQLRMILDFAGQEPNAARDRRVELPRLVYSEPEPPDADEVVTAVQAAGERFVLPLLVMEQLGTRVSETLALEPRDVDPEGGRVVVRREITKGSRGRWIAAPDMLVDALMERLPLRENRGAVTDALRRVKAPFHPHDLRHRRATLWHQAHVPAAELARRLGHAKPSMSLDTYSHVRPLREIPHQTLADLLR